MARHVLAAIFLVGLLLGCRNNKQAPPLTPSPTVAPVLSPTLPATVAPTPVKSEFDGVRAYDALASQVALGPRFPGSPGHLAVRRFILQSLVSAGWRVEEQRFDYQGFEAVNMIARHPAHSDGPITLIGAHYDTRARSDQSPAELAEQPTPGAVDGASGVAVLLELARVLELPPENGQVWLLFFDVEDNGGGGLPGWDWIVGSTHMAQNLSVTPAAMVLVDMVGDADQQLYWEGNSDPALRERLWNIAADLGYGDYFIPTLRFTMIDDHVPFARLGIPAVDIIDFDYPYWHTVEDSADKASPDSLYRVGRVLEVWLEG